MSWLILLAAAALAGVAAAGVLGPFGSNRDITLERLADPLEDERRSLLRTLKDLEEERASGSLSEEDYRSLRSDTEARTVTVLRTMELKEGRGELAAGLRELRSVASGNGAMAARASDSPRLAWKRWGPIAAVGAVAAGVIVLLLIGAVSNRQGAQQISGFDAAGTSGASGAQTSVAFFEQRVIDHPRDVAARLDLADRYLQGGDLKDAVAQYLSALQIEPRNAEAHASLGFVLYLSGKAEEGLQAVDQALAVAPSDPEALYFRGVILLRGLHRSDDAAGAFRQYLQAAPFGSRRAEVETLLRQAESGR